jgi:hypothetical protein
MSWRFFMVVVIVIFTQTGCTQSVLGVLLAPEAVVGSAANSVASSGAEALSATGLNQLSTAESTSMEIDRLLKDHPDTANAGRLRELQDSMRGEAKNTGPDQRMVMNEPPAPRRLMDKALPVRKGDLLSVSTPSSAAPTRRPVMRPEAQPTAETLKPDHTPVHAMSLTPVRLR